jgi:hypothetical protein
LIFPLLHHAAEAVTGAGVALTLFGQVSGSPVAQEGGLWVAVVGFAALVVRLWADDRRETREKDKQVATLKAENARILAELQLAQKLCHQTQEHLCPLKVVASTGESK